MTEQDALQRADAVTRTIETLQAAGQAHEKAVEDLNGQRKAVAAAGAADWKLGDGGHVIIDGSAATWPSSADATRTLITIREAETRIGEARASLKKYGIDPEQIARVLA